MGGKQIQASLKTNSTSDGLDKEENGQGRMWENVPARTACTKTLRQEIGFQQEVKRVLMGLWRMWQTRGWNECQSSPSGEAHALIGYQERSLCPLLPSWALWRLRTNPGESHDDDSLLRRRKMGQKIVKPLHSRSHSCWGWQRMSNASWEVSECQPSLTP